MITINPEHSQEQLLQWRFRDLSWEQKDELLNLLKQDKKDREKESLESLFWKKDAILKDLKESHVRTKESKEWKKFYINLPPNWDFLWFNFDFLVTNKQYKEQPLHWDVYWVREIIKFYDAIRQYMKSNWVDIDLQPRNYQDEFVRVVSRCYQCPAGEIFTELTWLSDMFSLRCEGSWRVKKHYYLKWWELDCLDYDFETSRLCRIYE